jgi:hypothetical protein
MFTQEPSNASLKGMPEVDFSKGHVRPNAYAACIAKEGIIVQVGDAIESQSRAKARRRSGATN